MSKYKLILNEDNDIRNIYGENKTGITSKIVQDASFIPKVKVLPTTSNKNIFGETLKTVGSTTADLLTNVGKGFLWSFESGVDAGRYAVAGIADVLGADDYAKKVRKNAEFDVTGWLTKDADELYNKKSVLKENGIIENVAKGVGQVGAMVGTSALLPTGAQSIKFGKLSMPTTSIITGAGSGIEEARKDGASEGKALLYGGLKGIIEGATEGMFGGLGKTFNKFTGGGALDDVIAKKLSSKISNKVLSNLVNAGVMSVGEGTEEVVSSVLEPIAKKIYSDKSLKELYKDTNLLEDFVVGSLTSAILQAPSTITNINQENKFENNIKKVESMVNNGLNDVKKEDGKSSFNNVQENNSIFSRQVDEVLNGTFNKNNHMTVLEHTPEVLQKLGVKDSPITLTTSKLDRIMNESGKQKGEYHGLKEIVKKLPEAIQNPLDIVKSYGNSYVLTTDLSDNQDRSIIVSLKINGKGYIDNIEIESNVMTSAYGRNNYDNWMKRHEEAGNIVYDIDRGYIGTKKLDVIPGLQLPNNNTKLNSDIQRLQLPNEVSFGNDSSGLESPNTIVSSIDNGIIKPSKSQIIPLPNTSNMQNTQNNALKVNNILNPNEISQLTIKDANTTPLLPKTNKNNKSSLKESSFYENITEKSKFLTEENRKNISMEEDVKYYQAITNEDTLNIAKETLDNGGMAETLNWFNRHKLDENGKMKYSPTAVDVAEGWILLKRYQDIGDYDSTIEVVKTMRHIGTQVGQTVQAFNILSRLTPEGMVKYAQSELSEAYEKMIKNKSQKWIDEHRSDFDLTPNEVKFIIDTMQEVSKMEDGYNKKVKLAEIQKLMTDKLPPDKGAGTKAWMRISMLFNPKTQVRNVLGNAVIAPVNTLSDFIASKADKAISNKTGIRTTGTTNVKSYAEGFKNGLFQSYNDFKKGINTRNIEGNRFEITTGKSFNDKTSIGKALNNVDSLLSFMLDAGDRSFYEGTFTNSINNQLVLNDTTEVTKDMVDIATSEALQRTWQDNNNYTKFVLNARKGLNQLLSIRGYGLGDVLIPFAKTPGNLTKAIIDYSPVGIINAINSGRNLKNSLSNGQYTPQMQHEFVQNLGKATAGTILYILGYALAKVGITSGKSDDDKDVANFMKNTLGVSSYSIKIGNKTFTYDWAQPIAAPLSIMANIVNKQKEGASLIENILSSLDTAGNVLLEQSFMESINTVLNNNNGLATGIQEALLELPSRAIPTLMKQIVDLTDSTQRQTFEYNKPIQTATNKIKSKIPGLSTTLSPTVDTLGREIQKYGGKNNVFNVFFNPANVNSENISESAKEIYKIYQETGNASVMPRQTAYYINKDNVKMLLTSKQRAEFQKVSGDIIEDSVSKLKENNKYTSMTSNDKAEVISNIVNYAYNKAREEVLGIEMSNQYNKAQEWIEKGNTIYDYYVNKEEADYSLENPRKYNTITKLGISYDDYVGYQKEVNKIKEEYYGTDNSKLRKQKVFEYINSLSYNKNQKIILFNLLGNYSISQNKQVLFQYINKQNLTKKEKEEIWNYLYK